MIWMIRSWDVIVVLISSKFCFLVYFINVVGGVLDYLFV